MRRIALFAAAVFAAIACGGAPAPPPASPPSPPAAIAPPADTSAGAPAPDAAAPSAESSLASKIDPIFAPFTQGKVPGCAVGVYHAGEIVFEKGYGYANLEWDGPMGPGTPMYLASMSKQFTAASVLLLVNEGKLARTDDVRKYIAELPDFGKVITIDELLHHTSGVRDYGLLFALSGHDDDDLATTQDVLSLMSRQKRLNFAPGTNYSYTNAGYVLLGQIVARVSGKTLAEFEKERLFDPLGMTSTLVKDDHTRIIPGRAAGYAPGKDKAIHLSMGHSQVVGQGNVISTIRDLAKWDGNFYAPKVGGQALVDAMRVRGVLADGTKLEYAAGLEEGVDPANGLPREMHNGGVGGYRTTMVRYPTAQTTVAVLCNSGVIDADALAGDVIKQLLPGKPAEAQAAPGEPKTATTPIDPAIAGLYIDRDSTMLRFFAIEGGALLVRASASGKGGLPLTPTAPNTFAARTGTTYVFSLAKGREPAKVVRKSPDGPPTTLVHSPAPAPLTAAALAPYAGRYGSDEVFRDSEVFVKGETLFIRSVGSLDEDTRLKPVSRDYFLIDGAGVEFERGRGGEITGVVISDERTRGVRLKRR